MIAPLRGSAGRAASAPRAAIVASSAAGSEGGTSTVSAPWPPTSHAGASSSTSLSNRTTAPEQPDRALEHVHPAAPDHGHRARLDREPLPVDRMPAADPLRVHSSSW